MLVRRRRIQLVQQLPVAVYSPESPERFGWHSLPEFLLRSVGATRDRPSRFDFLWIRVSSKQALLRLPTMWVDVVRCWAALELPLALDELSPRDRRRVVLHAPTWHNRHMPWQDAVNESKCVPVGDVKTCFRLFREAVTTQGERYTLKDILLPTRSWFTEAALDQALQSLTYVRTFPSTSTHRSLWQLAVGSARR